MSYSIIGLTISLFTFALFVNSAIVIVSGASLFGQADTEGADLFSIHNLLSCSVASIAGTLFALALLLSGICAGIVCTIAGQMVSEGQLRWQTCQQASQASSTLLLNLLGAPGRPRLACLI
jgi:metal iron transporter